MTSYQMITHITCVLDELEKEPELQGADVIGLPRARIQSGCTKPSW